MNPQVTAYLKIALAMAIVGSSVVFGKLITSSFPVFLASELRFLISTVILFLLLYYKEGKLPFISKKYVITLFFQAFAGVFLFNIFMLYGLRFTSAIEAGIITSTLPAVVGLTAFILLGEKITKLKSVGILLAVLGVLLFNVFGKDTNLDIASLFGNLLVFGSVIGEALFMILGKKTANKYTPLTVSTIMSLFGLLLFLPFSIYEGIHFDFSSVSAIDWINIFYFGIVVTVIAFILMYDGLSKVSASSAGILTGIMPVSSVIFSSIILGEELSVQHLLGIFLVIGAILVISLEQPDKKINI